MRSFPSALTLGSDFLVVDNLSETREVTNHTVLGSFFRKVSVTDTTQTSDSFPWPEEQLDFCFLGQCLRAFIIHVDLLLLVNFFFYEP